METPQDSHLNTTKDASVAGNYFRYMAEFVGFNEDDATAIRESGLIIEKHLPAIIANFYTNLLQYPPTRIIFLKKDRTLDEDYLQLRMLHQANFWRRCAGGEYDDDFARFVDYVGRAHTSRGADPKIYIAERYVIGMVGFVQHAIIDALNRELHDYDPDLEIQAIKGWNKLCMVILEMLARAYGEEHHTESLGQAQPVDAESILQMSVDSYEKGLGLRWSMETMDVLVAKVDDIPEGGRKIVEIHGISIGVFHHKGGWYAIRNSCLHRGGPVATGKLVNDFIVCPWHSYTYNIMDGRLVMDSSARLEMYPVDIRGEDVYLKFPVPQESEAGVKVSGTSGDEAQRKLETPPAVSENSFQVNELQTGQAKMVRLDGEKIAVYNVDGVFYATQDECTHAGGPLSEGKLSGKIISCPWHFSCFDVTNGAVTCLPATEALKTYTVHVEGDIGRVEKRLE